MTPDPISADLKAVLRRLKLSRLLDTLPERLTLARQQKMPPQDFLLLVLADEVTRRDGLAATLRAQRAGLDPAAQLEHWDPTAKVTFDRALLNELAALRFLDSHHHVTIVGPVGVGKTFLAHALGHIACRRGHSVLAVRTDQLLKTLKHARLTQSYEAELRKFVAVDLLLLDDFGLDAMDAQESRDAYALVLERHRTGSMVVTSSRGPDEWLATFADPVRAQSAIDRFTNSAYDLVIDGESYRARLKPTVKPAAHGNPCGRGILGYGSAANSRSPRRVGPAPPHPHPRLAAKGVASPPARPYNHPAAPAWASPEPRHVRDQDPGGPMLLNSRGPILLKTDTVRSPAPPSETLTFNPAGESWSRSQRCRRSRRAWRRYDSGAPWLLRRRSRQKRPVRIAREDVSGRIVPWISA